ncbi:hypothetical protein ACROYT_G042095 [Oculina patagonica]
MPKSITTLQNQINGCEQGIQEALALCASEVGDADYKLNFSLAEVVKNLPFVNIDEAISSVGTALHIFQQCERIFNFEQKRRSYCKEIRQRIKARDQRETVKRLTIQNNFKKKVEPMFIPNMHNKKKMEEQKMEEQKMEEPKMDEDHGKNEELETS